MSPTTRILIEVLARTDALFAPFRDWRKANAVQNAAGIIERRIAFRRAGIDFHVGGTPTERKLIERSLRALERDELLRIRRRSGRRYAVKLTEVADQAARALVGLPGLAVSLKIVDILDKMARLGACMDTPMRSGPHRL